MWRRALESNGEMRTRRCTPDSVFSQPCALWPLTHDRRRFDARLVAGRLFDHFDVEFAPLAPAHVHAQQHARPIAAFGAAGAGMHFDIGVVGRRPRPTAALRAGGARPRPSARAAARRPRSRSRRRPPARRVRPASIASSSSRSILLTPPSRSSSIVRSRISFCAASGSFQRLGSSDLAFSSARRRVAVSTSKMPPQQSHGLLDGFDQATRLRRAWETSNSRAQTSLRRGRSKRAAAARPDRSVEPARPDADRLLDVGRERARSRRGCRPPP